MIDPRMTKLADLLVNYSCKVQPKERVAIDAIDIPDEMTCVLIDAVVAAGGLPFVETLHARVRRKQQMNCSEEQLKLLCDRDLGHMKNMQCYIAVRGGHNITESADVPEDKTKLAQQHWQKPITDQRVNHTKWVVLRWPTPSMAQLAGMSTEAFEDFYFDVCTLDYARMARAEEPLKHMLEETDLVRIVGPGDTDIDFSIKGIPAIPCVGDRNIPDGELFTAPVKTSVNGVMHYNAGTVYNGKSLDDVRLVFKDGKVVEATASDTKALNDILDTDEGARYVGEFSLGFNPHIKRPMRDGLFDEKIAGSIHFTPGQAYEEADNGNRSKIHWDMVLIQTPEFGGGEIWFDGVLVRKDGMFLPDNLHCLNPENLV
jgi:aminopeptidase